MASFPRFKTVNLIHKAFEKAITGASTRAAKRARSEPAHNVYAKGSARVLTLTFHVAFSVPKP